MSGTTTWQQQLSTTKKGGIIPSTYNATIILSEDPSLANIFARNTFTAQDVLLRPPPFTVNGYTPSLAEFPRSWLEPDITLIQCYLQKNYSNRFGFQSTEHAMKVVAAAHRFHPVVDYLKTLHWDGTPRLDTWLITVFGTPDTTYARTLGAIALVGSVRRVLHPGCQFDLVVVLEGPQGIGKSSALRALFGDALFTDDMPHDFTSKDAPMQLLGIWCVELSEVAQLASSRHSLEGIKAFITRRDDRFRPPYGRGIITQLRQMVFFGTTNRRDWLSDITGNRRFAPITCQGADVSWISQYRDQLWAEAVTREATGEAIFFDDPVVEAAAKTEQDERRPEDPWTERTRSFLLGRSEFLMIELLDHLNIPTKDQSRPNQMRAAEVVRTLGWYTKTRWNPDIKDNQRIWLKNQLLP